MYELISDKMWLTDLMASDYWMRIKQSFSTWPLLLAVLTLAACETGPGLTLVLEKSAQSNELRGETTVGTPLPIGCPRSIISIPVGATRMNVSYDEPTVDHEGNLLSELAYTTIYLSSRLASVKSIRVWTNDPHGGAHVTIRDITVPGQEVGLCITATTWGRKESSPTQTITVD